MLIGYARVSTDDQSLDMQVSALVKAGCEGIFRETASGAKEDRPQLTEALKYARRGDTLVVWKLDRLARSLRQLLETIERLEQRGVELRSLTENVDTGTAGGKLVFSVFGAIAEFERALIAERTRAGLAEARAKGRVGGRPRKLSAADVQAARGMLAHLSVQDTAGRLGVSVSTLRRYVPRATCEERAYTPALGQ